MLRGRLLQGSLFASLFLASAGLSSGLQTCPSCAPAQTPAPPKMAMPPVGTPVTVLPAPPMPYPRPSSPLVAPMFPLPVVASDPMIRLDQPDDAAQIVIKNFRKSLEPGQKVVVVQTLCVQVPADFCEQAGLGNEKNQT